MKVSTVITFTPAFTNIAHLVSVILIFVNQLGYGETWQLSQLITSDYVSNISLCFDPRAVRKGIVVDEVAMRVVSEYFNFHRSLSFINVPYSYFIHLKPTPYTQPTESLNKTVTILFFHQLSPLSPVALFLK